MPVRILLVEDDPVSRDLLASLLLCRGYEVDTAEDGFNALRFVQDNEYALVFIDYHLPEMDGYALARLMRTLGEKHSTNLNMVAITADRFGLAARRGADSVFASMLAKPIDPDALYAFIDGFLGVAAGGECDTLDSFLAEPSSQDAQSAAQVLWRVRGVAELPAAAVFPAPTDAERQGLEYCFRLVEPAQADCLVLLRQAGLKAVEDLRASGVAGLLPLFTIEDGHAEIGDVSFKVGDGESWSAAAAVLARFRERRAGLKATAIEGADLSLRLAAYLQLAERTLILRRDAVGRTSVPYTAGFAAEDILAAVKRLAAGGLVTAKPGEAREDGTRELVIALTAKGVARVADEGATSVPSAG